MRKIVEHSRPLCAETAKMELLASGSICIFIWDLKMASLRMLYACVVLHLQVQIHMDYKKIRSGGPIMLTAFLRDDRHHMKELKNQDGSIRNQDTYAEYS